MRHLKIYRAIRLIQRQGSIRKAAEVMSVSPSALNRQIQGFEEEMTVEVFERIPSGVRLSAAGELLLDMIDRHLTEFDDMQSQLSDLRDGVAGTLRVSFGSDICAGTLNDALALFEQDYPGVSIEVGVDDTPDALHRHAADLAILTNPVTDDAVEVLFSQNVALAAWRGGAEAPQPAGTGLWDIVGGRMILPPHGTGTRAAVSHLLRRHRLSEGVTTTATAAQLDPHLANRSSVGIFPATVMAQGVRLPLDLGSVQITVLRAARLPLSRSAQAFLAVLQRQMDAMPPPG